MRAVADPGRGPLLPEGEGPDGQPVDPVARFHLGNGARLERLNFLGDVSPNGLRAVARADGQLPLRPRRDREEPRGVRREGHGRRLRRGAQSPARCLPRPGANPVTAHHSLPRSRIPWNAMNANLFDRLSRQHRRSRRRPRSRPPAGERDQLRRSASPDRAAGQRAPGSAASSPATGSRCRSRSRSRRSCSISPPCGRAASTCRSTPPTRSAELEYFLGDAEPALFVCDPAKRERHRADSRRRSARAVARSTPRATAA